MLETVKTEKQLFDLFDDAAKFDNTGTGGGFWGKIYICFGYLVLGMRGKEGLCEFPATHNDKDPLKVAAHERAKELSVENGKDASKVWSRLIFIINKNDVINVKTDTWVSDDWVFNAVTWTKDYTDLVSPKMKEALLAGGFTSFTNGYYWGHITQVDNLSGNKNKDTGKVYKTGYIDQLFKTKDEMNKAYLFTIGGETTIVDSSDVVAPVVSQSGSSDCPPGWKPQTWRDNFSEIKAELSKPGASPASVADMYGIEIKYVIQVKNS